MSLPSVALVDSIPEELRPLRLYEVPVVAATLAVSRSRLYEMMDAGIIRSVKVGRSRRIPAEALQEFRDSLTGGTLPTVSPE